MGYRTSTSTAKAPMGKEANWTQTRPGKELERNPAALRAASALVRQELKAPEKISGGSIEYSNVKSMIRTWIPLFLITVTALAVSGLRN